MGRKTRNTNDNLISCPNCDAQMNRDEPCPECEHVDGKADCECAFCASPETEIGGEA